MSVPEQTLIALAAAGDRTAFAGLVRLHQGAVRQYLRRLCQNADLADDLAQETFLHAMTRLGTFRGAGSFAGWLKRIAASQFLMHLRRQRGHKRLSDAWGHEALAHGADVAAAPGHAGSQMDLDRALATLSPAARMCLMLSHGADYSHSEIASLTGLPLGTVKSHVQRAMVQVRATLAAPQQTEADYVA